MSEEKQIAYIELDKRLVERLQEALIGATATGAVVYAIHAYLDSKAAGRDVAVSADPIGRECAGCGEKIEGDRVAGWFADNGRYYCRWCRESE